jgi:hypothetical protein
MLAFLVELGFTDFLTVNEHFQVVVCCKNARKSFIQRVWWQKHRLAFVKPDEFKHVRKLKFVHEDVQSGFQPIDFPSVTMLMLVTDKTSADMSQFANTLRFLEFTEALNTVDQKMVVPPTLTTLVVGPYYFYDVDFPRSLLHLTVGYGYSQNLSHGKLPSGLQTLTMNCVFHQETDILPSNLQRLSRLRTCFISGPISVPQLDFQEEYFKFSVSAMNLKGQRTRQCVNVIYGSLLATYLMKSVTSGGVIHLKDTLRELSNIYSATIASLALVQ